jgi:hypothetical protein
MAEAFYGLFSFIFPHSAFRFALALTLPFPAHEPDAPDQEHGDAHSGQDGEIAVMVDE